MIGVAASNASRSSIIVAGLSGLVAGAMAMGTGEYNSVSSQRDTERADIAREIREQAVDPDLELAELTDIYVGRGLDREFAREVARQLTATDPIGSHLRDELGIHESGRARPVQAAVVSASSFSIAGAVPVLAMLAAPADARIPVIAAVALVLLAALGALGARLGGAPLGRAAARVLIGSGLAMAVTALIGDLVGNVV